MNTQYVIINVANGNQLVPLEELDGFPYPPQPWSSLVVATDALRWARQHLLSEGIRTAYMLFVCQPMEVDGSNPEERYQR